MKIRDGHAVIAHDPMEYLMPSGSLDIISEDGRTLFVITLNKDGSIRVSAGHVCKHLGILLDDGLQIKPLAGNVVTISRPALLTKRNYEQTGTGKNQARLHSKGHP